ncbi:Cullin-3 [Mortierella sp. AM989]|nr:Cullin-3 [Mortierella sp. AM989]
MASLQGRRPVKGKIRPPQRMSNTETLFDTTWSTLANAITTIHEQRAHTLSYEEVYRCGYNLVIHKSGERLYHGVKDLIETYLESEAEKKIVPVLGIADTSPSEGVQVLKAIQKLWKHHVTCLLMISYILIHMDKNYVPQSGLPRTYDMGLYLFRDTVIRSPKYPIRSHLQKILLNQITMERKGDVIDRGAVKSCTEMLLELKENQGFDSVYITDFETQFVEMSREFYKVESDELVRRFDPPEYMRKVENRLNEEQLRCTHYLTEKTEPKIREIVEEEMIAKHLKTIMEMDNWGLKQLLINDRLKDLDRMYRLFTRVPNGPLELQASVSSYIVECGKAINANVHASSAENTEKGTPVGVALALRWMQEVLDLKGKFDVILSSAFAKDKSFENAINSAFETFICLNPKAPEFMSLFIDNKLKKDFKGKSDDEVENILNKTTTLFRFLSDKDVFERYYKQHLSNRLLHGKSLSDEAERGMIGKLKIECGYQFTSKLEGMFQDMRLTTDTMASFRDFLENAVDPPPIELSVTVLTSTYWPVPSIPVTCNLPADFLAATRVFERFYTSRHNGRKLTWHTTMGNVDLRATFDTRKHELNVSTMAAMVLLLFNNVADGESLSYTEIEEETGLPAENLKRTLQSVACGKFKILIKEPKSRDISETDTFKFNSAFTEKLSRIKIQTVASRVESAAELKETQEKVEDARKHMAEAAIVRVMKNRKSLDHNNLITEVISQLQGRFNPAPSMIKKRIEALIEREYLERAPGNSIVMAQQLDLIIAPGKHLGWFRLGMSLWDIIRLLREQAALIPVVELKYSEEDPFAADIVLKLVSNGIELRFEPYSQRLKLVHVYDFSRLRLTYKGGEVCSSKALPTFLLINRLFGPTYPGEFDVQKNIYTLSYPGLSLVFPIPEKLIFLYQTSAELPIEFPDGNTPVASHMYIFHGADWLTAAPVPVSTLARNIQDSSSPSTHSGRVGEGRPELEKVLAKINYGAILQFVGANQPQKCLIQLNVTTPQDLLADLGSPGSIYYKEDDKMQIHSDTDDSPQIQQEDDGILGEMEDIGYDRTNRPAEGFDSEYAKLPPIAPQRSHSPSPTSNSPQPQGSSGETAKSGKKKKWAASSVANDVMDPNPSVYSSGDSPHGSPDMLGSSPVPTLNHDLSNLQQTPRSSAAATPTGGLTAISPEKGIMPDMKISMVMTLLDVSSSATSVGAGGAGIPNKQGLIFNRGSKTQDPFKSTTLNGTDGVVFEAMHNGHIATFHLSR